MHPKEGTTALILASTEGYDTLVKLLLDRGANIEASNKVNFVTLTDL